MATITVSENAVLVPANGVQIRGDLALPAQSRGLIIFAHGSGSGRLSPRNRFVAEVLHDGGLATLLLDLLTESEETVDQYTRQFRFDIDMLARRLEDAIAWAAAHNDRRLQQAPVGLFGASTGAAAALIAAANRSEVRAVVSRGGRPDLAGEALSVVQAPTLLIVGSNDDVVLRLNREAMAQMHAPVQLEIIPGASHLFEEGDTLARAAIAARTWFLNHL